MKGRALRVDTKAKRLQNNPEIAGYFGIPEDESWLQRRVRQRRRQGLQNKPGYHQSRQERDLHRAGQLNLISFLCTRMRIAPGGPEAILIQVAIYQSLT